MTDARWWGLVGVLLLTSGCDDTKKVGVESAPAVAPSGSSEVQRSGAPYLGAAVRDLEILSPVWTVDKIYRSRQGPHATEEFAPLPSGEPELVWIIGFEATMVAPDGKSPEPQEFMCHTNLDVDPNDYLELFGATQKRISGRLFTLSQGQHRIDLPKGYGIPMVSSELLSLNTQVLNLNMHEGTKQVRHRVVLRFVRDSELNKPMKALYSAGAYGLKLLDGKDGHYGRPTADEHAGPDEHGAACLPGENAGRNEFNDNEGRKFTGHWVVKPGREVNHTRVTDIMDLPFDTRLHYVAVHLHPFAESMELRDLTTGKSVYKAMTSQAKKGVGLEHVDFFSSEVGVPLFKDHEYEVVSVYNNTSGEDQDSMAVLNLYMHDPEFKKPDLSKVKPKSKSTDSSDEGQQHHHGDGPKNDGKPKSGGKLM